MIDVTKTRPRHLLVAVPAAAWAGALTFLLFPSLMRPPTHLSAVYAHVLLLPRIAVWALSGAVFFLPIVLLVALPGYFTLRRLNRLAFVPCALIGLIIGLGYCLSSEVLMMIDRAPFRFPDWFFGLTLCVAIGFVSASVGYVVLLLLSWRTPPNHRVQPTPASGRG